MKMPFFTIKRTSVGGLHSFNAFEGESKQERLQLLENCMEGLEQVFGRRAARCMAQRIFNLKPAK